MEAVEIAEKLLDMVENHPKTLTAVLLAFAPIIALFFRDVRGVVLSGVCFIPRKISACFRRRRLRAYTLQIINSLPDDCKWILYRFAEKNVVILEDFRFIDSPEIFTLSNLELVEYVPFSHGVIRTSPFVLDCCREYFGYSENQNNK